MNKTFEKIYSENNVILNKDMVLKENTALFEKVYAEAEMLNEMNPKLRALLAAGLIGTAGLGATSCSTPNDDYEEPTAIEQPATPETPGSTTETPGSTTETPGSTTETPGSTTETPAETEDTKETAALSGFKALGVEDYAENLANAKKQIRASTGEIRTYQYVPIQEGITSYIYRNGHFELASSNDEDAFDDISERGDIIYIRYNKANNRYYVPKDMESDFDTAIAAYKAAYAE